MQSEHKYRHGVEKLGTGGGQKQLLVFAPGTLIFSPSHTIV